MKYKQYIIPVVLLFLFNACETQTKESDVNKIKQNPEDLINKIDIHNLEILEIDKCEYIFYKKSPSTNKGYGFMAHKGNCKNPIHYYSRSKKDH